VDLKVRVFDQNSRKANDRFNYHRIRPLKDQVTMEHMPKSIIGLDLGERYTVGACSKNLNSKSKMQTLSVKMRALNEPTRTFSNWLEQRKRKQSGLMQIESTPARKTANESDNDYWNRALIRYSSLATFYNSNVISKRRWELKKEQKTEYFRVLKQLLRMVGGKIGRKVIHSHKVNTPSI
jgi:hypothetical protein